jgi:hypothetical protein
MAIIEFLFNNIVVLIFIFGLISFLLQRRRGNTTPQQGRGAMPPFGGEPGRTITASRGTPPRSVPPSNVESARVSPEPVVRPALTDLAVVSAEPKTRQATPAFQTPNVRFNNPVQGMIWAEVFGPPRSRKPHTTKK